jgi:hypothetical protein
MGSASSHPELEEERPAAQRHEGIMFKESETLKEWNQRFCVLDNRVLSYWDSEELRARGERPRGVISLENCRVVLAEDDPKHLDSLYIETPPDARRMAAQRSQTRMYFHAKTLTELETWLRKLQISSREPWQRDEGVEGCPVCRLIAFDMTNRKHHCRCVRVLPDAAGVGFSFAVSLG